MIKLLAGVRGDMSGKDKSVEWVPEVDKDGYLMSVKVIYEGKHLMYVACDKRDTIKIGELENCYIDLNENNILMIRRKHTRVFDDSALLIAFKMDSKVTKIKSSYRGLSFRYVKLVGDLAIAIVTFRSKLQVEKGKSLYVSSTNKGSIHVECESGHNTTMNPFFLTQDKIDNFTFEDIFITSTKVNNIMLFETTSKCKEVMDMLTNSFNFDTVSDRINHYRIAPEDIDILSACNPTCLNEIYRIVINGETPLVPIDTVAILSKLKIKYRLTTIYVNTNTNRVSFEINDSRSKMEVK